ncbi:phage tail protein I [Stenotrophomonas sp. TWI273]|uniref:phage tail protein I n=1 Tax=Stenotrophomonas sp. TWI273 TaxID=3136774 RepID=UPI003209C3F7
MSSLLPPNATPQEVAVAKTMARVSDVPAPFDSALDPMRASETMLPWLAWSFSVDTWGPEWPVYVRRRTVQQSIKIHRRKGTIGALLDAVDAVGVPVEIEEWHQQSPQGAPYTFRVLVNSIATPFLKADLQRLLQAIEDTKNLRSHLTELVPMLTSFGTPNVAAATAQGVERQVESRFSDISLLLVAIEEGDAEVSAAADALHFHINTTLPRQFQGATE